MIEQFRRFMTTTAGRVVSILLSLALLAVAVYAVNGFIKGDSPDAATHSMYIDAENGKVFKHENKLGEQSPVLSPYSNKNTGFAAEPCNWTKDGQVKADPTWVLLNVYIGKSDPTFCPDCGRLVVGHNPEAIPGGRPPPTKDEWLARHGSP